MTDLLLAYDVCWRSVLGPRPWVQLSIYGPDARATATALCMEIEGDMAYLTEATPELAERIISNHIKVAMPRKRKARKMRKNKVSRRAVTGSDASACSAAGDKS